MLHTRMLWSSPAVANMSPSVGCTANPQSCPQKWPSYESKVQLMMVVRTFASTMRHIFNSHAYMLKSPRAFKGAILEQLLYVVGMSQGSRRDISRDYFSDVKLTGRGKLKTGISSGISFPSRTQSRTQVCRTVLCRVEAALLYRTVRYSTVFSHPIWVLPYPCGAVTVNIVIPRFPLHMLQKETGNDTWQCAFQG